MITNPQRALATAEQQEETVKHNVADIQNALAIADHQEATIKRTVADQLNNARIERDKARAALAVANVKLEEQKKATVALHKKLKDYGLKKERLEIAVDELEKMKQKNAALRGALENTRRRARYNGDIVEAIHAHINVHLYSDSEYTATGGEVQSLRRELKHFQRLARFNGEILKTIKNYIDTEFFHSYKSDNYTATSGGDHDDDGNTSNHHGNHDSQGDSRGGNSDASHDSGALSADDDDDDDIDDDDDDDCQEDEPSGAAIASTGKRVASRHTSKSTTANLCPSSPPVGSNAQAADSGVRASRRSSAKAYRQNCQRGMIVVESFDFAQGGVTGTENGCTVISHLNLRDGLNRDDCRVKLPTDVIKSNTTENCIFPLSQLRAGYDYVGDDYVDISDTILYMQKVGFLRDIDHLRTIGGNALNVNLQQVAHTLVHGGDNSGCTFICAGHCININKYGQNNNPHFEIIDSWHNPMLRSRSTKKATQWACKNEKALLVCLEAHIMHSLSEKSRSLSAEEIDVNNMDPRYCMFYVFGRDLNSPVHSIEGNFSSALASAKTQGKLLLVNLQDCTNPLSAELNELWNETGMISCINEGFVLWQRVRLYHVISGKLDSVEAPFLT
jgi:hypothetical protein